MYRTPKLYEKKTICIFFYIRLSTYLFLTSVSNSVLPAKDLCFYRFDFVIYFSFLQASIGKYLLCTFILLNISLYRVVGKILSEDEIRAALDLYNKEASELCHRTNIARWDAVTDIENVDKEAEKVSFSCSSNLVKLFRCTFSDVRNRFQVCVPSHAFAAKLIAVKIKSKNTQQPQRNDSSILTSHLKTDYPVGTQLAMHKSKASFSFIYLLLSLSCSLLLGRSACFDKLINVNILWPPL